MVLDSQTLSGLDIIREESIVKSRQDSGRSTLWEYLDRTVTPAGRRILRFWATHPLFRAVDVQARLDAVGNLLQLQDGSLVELDRELKKLPDLERKITRIHVHAASCARGQGVAEAAATQKRVIRQLLACLDGFDKVEGIRKRLVALTDEVMPYSASLVSELRFWAPMALISCGAVLGCRPC